MRFSGGGQYVKRRSLSGLAALKYGLCPGALLVALAAIIIDRLF